MIEAAPSQEQSNPAPRRMALTHAVEGMNESVKASGISPLPGTDVSAPSKPAANKQ